MRAKREKSPMTKYTFKDFECEFPTDGSCLEWLKNYLYPNGINCAKCGKVTTHHRITNRRAYACDSCGEHVYPCADTIYHKSSTSLRTWFHAIFIMASTRCGVSAKQIERQTGVTYKTAWRMCKQIRSMLDESDGNPLSGKVEVDETYVGGKPRYRNPANRQGPTSGNKAIIAGAVERGGRVRVRKVENAKGQNLIPFVTDNIAPETCVFTDDNNAYWALAYNRYTHKTIDHSKRVYAIGDIHTNGIEGFWSLVKGGIHGVYKHVSHKYVESYFNEYGFRYSHRWDVTPMFRSFLTQVEKLPKGE